MHKQRITGIIVLVLLVIVVVPLLFTGTKQVAKQAQMSAEIPVPPAKPVMQQPGEKQKPKVWVVQLGTFSKPEHANNLIKKLTAKGFAAYINKRPTANGFIYIVLVGPEADRAKAQSLLVTLQTKFKLQGILYSP